MGDARGSYDRIAGAYKAQFDRELDGKPFDREFLDRFASEMKEGSVLIDLGCGPGQIGRRLSGHGLQVVGVDLSVEMLRAASGGTAALVQADMRAVPTRAGSVEGVVAFYSLIHIPPDELEAAISEIARVVRVGGLAGIAVHATQPPGRAATAEPIAGGGLRIGEMLSQPVDLDFYFYGLEQVTGLLEASGLEILWAQEREPYPEGVEVQTRRAYVLARKRPFPG